MTLMGPDNSPVLDLTMSAVLQLTGLRAYDLPTVNDLDPEVSRSHAFALAQGYCKKRPGGRESLRNLEPAEGTPKLSNSKYASKSPMISRYLCITLKFSRNLDGGNGALVIGF